MKCIHVIIAIIVSWAVVDIEADIVVLEPVADVNTKYNVATENGGNIAVKHDSFATGNTRKGYVRFDLSGINVATVQSATLKMTVVGSGGASIYLYGLKDGVGRSANGRWGDEAWSEDDLWGNHSDAPANEYDSGTYIGDGDPNIDNQMYGFYGSLVTPVNTQLYNIYLASGTVAGTVKSFSNSKLLDWIKEDSNGTATLMLYNKTAFSGVLVQIAATEHATYNPIQLELDVIRGMVISIM